MEDVAADEHDLRRELDDLVDCARERQCDVCFALVDAARSYPLILAVAEMQVGEVDEAQVRSGPGRMREKTVTDCDGWLWGS